MSIERESTVAYGFLIKPGTPANEELQKKYLKDDIDINEFGLHDSNFRRDFPLLTTDTAVDQWSGHTNGLIIYAGSSVVRLDANSSSPSSATALNGVRIPDEELAQLIGVHRQFELSDEPGWVAWHSIY